MQVIRAVKHCKTRIDYYEVLDDTNRMIKMTKAQVVANKDKISNIKVNTYNNGYTHVIIDNNTIKPGRIKENKSGNAVEALQKLDNGAPFTYRIKNITSWKQAILVTKDSEGITFLDENGCSKFTFGYIDRTKDLAFNFGNNDPVKVQLLLKLARKDMIESGK